MANLLLRVGHAFGLFLERLDCRFECGNHSIDHIGAQLAGFLTQPFSSHPVHSPTEHESAVRQRDTE